MVKKLCGALLIGILGSGLLAAAPVGWRTDGTGRYPQADPPTEWSAEKNVVWSCPMPSWSNSSPAVIDDRIFVCSEPTDLVCVNKSEGKILWTKSNAYDLVMTPQDKESAAQDKLAADRVRKAELAPLQSQLNAAKREQRLQPGKGPKSPKSAKATTGPATAPAAPVASKAQQDAARNKVRDLEKQIDALNVKLAALTRWELPPTQPTNGHSSASPVSDGKLVVAVFNTGLAVCYDIDGNLKWAKFIDKPPHKEWGSCSSPVIFQDRVLVHFVNLVALDLQTGKELWKAPNTEWHWGTPVITRVGEVDVVVTADGDVVRLGDGKVMARKLCGLTYNSPIIHDGVAYLIQGKGKAVKLTPAGEAVEAKVLWTTQPKDDRYYSSPLLHENLIYAINQARHYSVIDAADGKVLATKLLDVGRQTVYSSITLAGKYLYVSNEDGTTVVMEPGTEMKVLAKNTLEKFRTTPVFEGQRMYIRGRQNLWCIGQ